MERSTFLEKEKNARYRNLPSDYRAGKLSLKIMDPYPLVSSGNYSSELGTTHTCTLTRRQPDYQTGLSARVDIASVKA